MVDPKSKRMQKAKAKKPRNTGKKFDAKLFAIALILAMLFVSYVVIFSSQTPSRPSKNMVFSYDQDQGFHRGNVRNIDLNLSNVTLTIKDSGADSENSTENLTTGLTLETEGNLYCTFVDSNGNGRLDKEDEFRVYNASPEDKIELREKDKETEELVAYYTF